MTWLVQVEHISDSDSDSAVSSAMEVEKNYLFGDNLFKFSQIWQALKIHGQWSTAIELRRSIERNINSPLSGPNFIIIRNLLEIWHEEMFERQLLNINLTCRGVGQAPSPPLASSQTTSTKDQRTSSFQIGIFTSIWLLVTERFS